MKVKDMKNINNKKLFFSLVKAKNIVKRSIFLFNKVLSIIFDE